MLLFYHFNFESNYDILKSKSPCFLLNKNINFNKNETASKMENLKHTFKETKMSWSLRKKNECIFVPFILSGGNFFDTIFFYLSV